MENENKILKYLDKVVLFKLNKDKEGLEALQKEGREVNVTLEDVSFALMDLIDILVDYVDVYQALSESRLRTIVSCLEQDTQNKILEKFNRAGDDLFIDEDDEEKGEEENGKKENNESN